MTEKEKVWRFPPPKPPEPETNIWTPNGDYTTTVALAEQLSEFFKETELEYTGAIGGQYNYIFTATSLGTILIIEDGKTKRQINVTDYSQW